MRTEHYLFCVLGVTLESSVEFEHNHGYSLISPVACNRSKAVILV